MTQADKLNLGAKTQLVADKLYLLNEWRVLTTSLGVLLDNEEFCSTFKGAAMRLKEALKKMERVATASIVVVDKEVYDEQKS